MHINEFATFPSVFTHEQMDQIVRMTDHIEAGAAQVLSPDGESSISRNTVRRCTSGWLHQNRNTDHLFSRIWNTVSQVNDKRFGFEVDSMEPLQYLRYGPLNFFRWHTDNGSDPVKRRKLTAIINLTGPRDHLGGRLQIKGDGPKSGPLRQRGCMTVFPSHLLHRATPVWLGERKVLVAWISGKRPLR